MGSMIYQEYLPTSTAGDPINATCKNQLKIYRSPKQIKVNLLSKVLLINHGTTYIDESLKRFVQAYQSHSGSTLMIDE